MVSQRTAFTVTAAMVTLALIWNKDWPLYWPVELLAFVCGLFYMIKFAYKDKDTSQLTDDAESITLSISGKEALARFRSLQKITGETDLTKLFRAMLVTGESVLVRFYRGERFTSHSPSGDESEYNFALPGRPVPQKEVKKPGSIQVQPDLYKDDNVIHVRNWPGTEKKHEDTNPPGDPPPEGDEPKS